VYIRDWKGVRPCTPDVAVNREAGFGLVFTHRPSISFSLRIKSRLCSSGRIFITVYERPSCMKMFSLVINSRTCSMCITMHRSRHKIAAEYESLRLGSSIRKSRIGTPRCCANLCLSIVTGVQTPSSLILSQARGPAAVPVTGFKLFRFTGSCTTPDGAGSYDPWPRPPPPPPPPGVG
jgi:hypothetical protein